MLFLIAALAAFTRVEAGGPVNADVAKWGTFAGAPCFAPARPVRPRSSVSPSAWRLGTPCPPALHGQFSAAADRVDPLEVLERQAATRVPRLVPIRYGRMLATPFTSYRGAAAVAAQCVGLIVFGRPGWRG